VLTAVVLHMLHLRSTECPITDNRMSDPVQLADGHAYGKHAVESWLRQVGADSFPRPAVYSHVTGEKLSSLEVVPFASLRWFVQQYEALKGPMNDTLRLAWRRGIDINAGEPTRYGGEQGYACRLLASAS
jgi:hypothetical protein